MTRSIFALAVLLCSSTIASSASPESIEARLDRLERKYSNLQKVESKLSKEVSSEVAKKASTEKKAAQSMGSTISNLCIAPLAFGGYV